MNMITRVNNDLRNPKCEGFFLESDGNEMTVRRINNWQFDVTVESWRGNTNNYYALQAHEVQDLVYGWLVIDDYGIYVPHYASAKWSDSEVERFMTTLCPKMCNPFFKGFTLSADDANTYAVHKHPNGIEWTVDDKVTDFGGVLRMTRAKLAEEHMWKFAAI